MFLLTMPKNKGKVYTWVIIQFILSSSSWEHAADYQG